MAKRTKKQDVTFGDPLNWTPRPVLHPQGCRCIQCERLIKWSQGYQKYIAKVDR